MSTASNASTDPSTTPPAPANPAKGSQRGQTTLAAEIDRWQALADNLAPQVDQMPGLKEPFAQFQILLAEAKTVRNQLNTLRADTATALTQRDQLVVDGGALFTRLSLGLQSFHGPRNPRLRAFGLKPKKKPTGRRPTNPIPTPPVEVAPVHPPASTPKAPAAPTAE
jgi:hypothetical protein